MKRLLRIVAALTIAVLSGPIRAEPPEGGVTAGDHAQVLSPDPARLDRCHSVFNGTLRKTLPPSSAGGSAPARMFT
jgi:hypothetical protein